MVSTVRGAGNLILGINSVFHESSACLLDGAEVLAFAEEERFSRVKRAKRPEIDNADVLPVQAIDYCLSSTGAAWSDIVRVAYSYDPDLRFPFARDDVMPGEWGSVDGEKVFVETVHRVPSQLSALAGVDLVERFRWVPHHLAHASSVYFASPYEDAAVLSVDGIGRSSSKVLSRNQADGIQED